MKKKCISVLCLCVFILLFCNLVGCSEKDGGYTCENGDVLVLSEDGSFSLVTQEEPHEYIGLYQTSSEGYLLTLTQKDGVLLAEPENVYVTFDKKTFSYAPPPATPPAAPDESPCLHTHTEIRNVQVRSCTEDGYSGDTFCLDCQQVLENGTVLPKRGHTFTDFTSEADAGSLYLNAVCSDNEIRFFKCIDCGTVATDPQYTYEVSGTATGEHSYTGKSDVVCLTATCGRDGTNYCCCSVCGKIGSNTYVVPATGKHDFSLQNDEILIRSADCGHNAVYAYVCSVCGEPSRDLTYEKEGTKTSIHTFTESSGVVKSEANCIADRVEYARCAVCGMTDETKTVTVPDTKNGVHLFNDLSDVVAKEATCTRSRYNYYKCAFCGLVSTQKTYVVVATAHGHSYSDHICSECGKVEDAIMTWDVSEDKKTDSVQAYFFKEAGDPLYKVILAGSGRTRCFTDTESVVWSRYAGSVGTVIVVGSAPYADGGYLYTGVTSVGDRCFAGCSSLHTLSLAETVTEVGSYAFAHDEDLQTVVFPSSLLTVGKGAFAECSSLCGVDFSACSSLTSIGYSAFENCSSLDAVDLRDTAVTSVKNNTFCGCKKLSEILLPQNVEKISEYAFSNTYIGLEKVGTLAEEGEVFTVDGKDYFYKASTVYSDVSVGTRTPALREFSINEITYTYADNEIFRNSVKIADAVYTDTVITFPDEKFYCKNNNIYPEAGSVDSINRVLVLVGETFHIDESIYRYRDVDWTGYSALTEIGMAAFSDCRYLTSMKLPTALRVLGGSVFENDVLLQSVSFGNNLTSIGKNAVLHTAFYNSYSSWNDSGVLVKDDYYLAGSPEEHFGVVETPSGNPSVRKYYEKQGDEYVLSLDTEIADKVYYRKISKTSGSPIMTCRLIADGAFDGCVDLTGIFTDALYIGNEAFRTCISVQTVMLSMTKEIGKNAFSSCAKMQQITLPDTLTKIGDEAFSYCTELRSLTIYDTAVGKNILLGDHLFELYTTASGYQNEDVPVVHIDDYAASSVIVSDGTYLFAYTGGKGYLVGMIKPETVTLSLPETFTYGTQSPVVVDTYEIYDYAFYNDVYRSQFVSVDIPSSVSAIGEYAFYDCASLETVYLPTSVKAIGKKAFLHTKLYETASNWQNSALYLPSSDVNESYVLLAVEPGIGVKLTDVTVLAGTYLIADEAFVACKELSYLECPSSVKNVGKNVLRGNRTIGTLKVPFVGASDGEEAYLAYYFGGIAFDDNVSELIPDTLYSVSVTTAKTIYDNTFKNCSYLSAIVIGVADTIGEYAFYGCDTAVIALNRSIKSVGAYAFYDCRELSEINFDEIVSVPEYAFYHTGLLTVSFPEETTTIAFDAFRESVLLHYVIIGGNVTSVGEEAFYGCIGLVHVVFSAGSSAITVGANAFYGCKKLIEVDASKRTSMTDLEINTDSYGCVAKYAVHLVKDTSPTILTLSDGFYRAFFNNAYYVVGYTLNNDKIELPEKYSTQREKYNVYAYAFAENYRIATIQIGNAVQIIGKEAFFGCENLKSVMLTTSLNTIQEGAFSESAVVGISFVSANGTGSTALGVKSIEKNAFANCSDLKSVTFGSSVTSIGEKAFYGCIGLTKVVMPTNLSIVGKEVFANCTALREIDMASIEVKSMGQGIFNDCPALEKLTWRTTVAPTAPSTSNPTEPYGYFVGSGNKMRVTFTENVQQIPNYLFYMRNYPDEKTPSVSTVAFSNNTETIGKYAFYKLAVSSITFPTALYEIDEYAFMGSALVGDIVFPTSLGIIGVGAFMDCKNLNSVKYEGEELTSLPKNVFAGCSSLYYASFSDSIITLGKDGFYGCTALSVLSLGMALTETSKEAFTDCTALKTVYLTNVRKEDVSDEAKTAFAGITLRYVYFDENIVMTVKRASSIQVHIEEEGGAIDAKTVGITTAYSSAQTTIVSVSNKAEGSVYGAGKGTADYTVAVTVPVQKGEKNGNGSFSLSCKVTVN